MRGAATLTFPGAERIVPTEASLSQAPETLEMDWAAGLCLEGYGPNTAHYARLPYTRIHFNWKTFDYNLSSPAQ